MAFLDFIPLVRNTKKLRNVQSSFPSPVSLIGKSPEEQDLAINQGREAIGNTSNLIEQNKGAFKPSTLSSLIDRRDQFNQGLDKLLSRRNTAKGFISSLEGQTGVNTQAIEQAQNALDTGDINTALEILNQFTSNFSSQRQDVLGAASAKIDNEEIFQDLQDDQFEEYKRRLVFNNQVLEDAKSTPQAKLQAYDEFFSDNVKLLSETDNKLTTRIRDEESSLARNLTDIEIGVEPAGFINEETAGGLTYQEYLNTPLDLGGGATLRRGDLFGFIEKHNGDVERAFDNIGIQIEQEIADDQDEAQGPLRRENTAIQQRNSFEALIQNIADEYRINFQDARVPSHIKSSIVRLNDFRLRKAELVEAQYANAGTVFGIRKERGFIPENAEATEQNIQTFTGVTLPVPNASNPNIEEGISNVIKNGATLGKIDPTKLDDPNGNVASNKIKKIISARDAGLGFALDIMFDREGGITNQEEPSFLSKKLDFVEAFSIGPVSTVSGSVQDTASVIKNIANSPKVQGFIKNGRLNAKKFVDKLIEIGQIEIADRERALKEANLEIRKILERTD